MTQNSQDPTALGTLLKTRRQQQGFSRTRVAQMTGIKPITLEGWEGGRVRKPPIHDVLRLARALQIPTEELERAVGQDEAASGPEGAASAPRAEGEAADDEATPVGSVLLGRAAELLDWSDDDAAAALNVTPERVRRLRTGEADVSVAEVMALIARLVAYLGERGDSAAEVSALLAQLRDVRV